MKRNIREQLKEKDIKITELADYLGIGTFSVLLLTSK